LSYHSKITLNINGQTKILEVDHRWTVLDVLRNLLDLTGAKRGCNQGECGSCTVLLEGKPINSCQFLAIQADQKNITTIESLNQSQILHPIQQSFLEYDGAQCGFCTPGILMSVKALLDENPDPSIEQIKESLSGNLCRCNAYGRIIKSVQMAARMIRLASKDRN